MLNGNSKTKLDVIISRAGISDSNHIIQNLLLISDDEAAGWAERLYELQNECGCKIGARFVFLSFTVGLAILLTTSISVKIFIVRLFLLFLFMFIAGLLGKLFGKIVSRRKFLITVEQLKILLSSRIKEG
jgi:hypothetical protein